MGCENTRTIERETFFRFRYRFDPRVGQCKYCITIERTFGYVFDVRYDQIWAFVSCCVIIIVVGFRLLTFCYVFQVSGWFCCSYIHKMNVTLKCSPDCKRTVSYDWEYCVSFVENIYRSAITFLKPNSMFCFDS